jgi:hypothetical protein
VTGLDEDKGATSGDRKGVGGRLALERIVGPKVRVAAIASAVRSRYSLVDAIFLVEREDTRYDFEAFLRYQFAPQVEARLGAWRSVQDSNIPISNTRARTGGFRYRSCSTRRRVKKRQQGQVIPNRRARKLHNHRSG